MTRRNIEIDDLIIGYLLMQGDDPPVPAVNFDGRRSSEWSSTTPRWRTPGPC